MIQPVLRPPLCAVVLMGAVLAPALVLAQSRAAGSSAAASAPVTAAARKPSPAPRVKLDLQAPPLSHIYPRQQLQYILAIDSADGDDAQEVSVQSNKYLMPVPRSQILAIPWALMHPDQAWRIFTPIEAP